MAPLDLLSWPDVKDAERRVELARAELARAQRRFWLAPRGERMKRESAMKTASERALRADLELAAIVQQASE